MSNFGQLSVQFYDSNLDLLYDNGGTLNTTGPGETTLYPLSAKGSSYFKRIGHGSFTMPPVAGTFTLGQVGQIAVVYQSDAIAGDDMPVACFRVDRVELTLTEDGPMLTRSGPDMAQELVDWLVHEDVGVQEMATTQVRYNKGVGETTLVIDDSTDFEDGDDIVIRNGYLDVLYRGVVDGAPSVGTGPGGEDEIDIDPPLYNAVAYDTYITATDYRNPTTEDITQIMNRINQFAQWGLTVQGGGSGTVAGTSHAANGQTTLDMLNAAAGMTGEWWRLLARSSGSDAPQRELEWRSSSDSSGVTLVVPSQADTLSTYTNTAYGIIESVTREYDDGRISHCIATGGGTGDEALTLADATDAAPAGYTLTVNESLGYAILAYDALVSEFSPTVREVKISFAHIRPSGTSDDARQVAGNQLLAATVQFMADRNEKFRFYRIVAVIHKELQIGQSIAISYSDHTLTLSETLYITELDCEVGEDGARRYTLLCGERLQTRLTGELAVVSRVANAEGAVGSLSVGALGSTGGGTVALSVDSTPVNALTVAGPLLTFTSTSDGKTNPSNVLAADSSGNLAVAAFTADSVAIDGSVSARLLHVNGTTTNDQGVRYAPTVVSNTSGQAGVQIQPVFTPGAATATIFGTLGVSQLGTTSASVTNFFANYYRGDTLAGYSGALGSLYALYLSSPSIAGSSPSANYGLFIGDQTAGTSSNYAIYTGSGVNRFGGDVGIGGESSPASTVEVRASSGGSGFGGTDGTGAIRVSLSSGYGVGIDTWDSGSPRWGILGYSADTPTVMIEGVYSDTHVRFSSGGSVIIGKTSSAGYKLDVSGSTGIDGDLTFVGAQAITTTSGALTVQPVGNLALNPDSGTITADADLQFTGAQSITTSSGNLGINPAGGTVTMDADLQFTGAQQITTSADSLTIAPAADLVLNTGGGQVFMDTTTDLQGESWVSGLYGAQFGIDTSTGLGDFRALQTEELHAWVFNATETLVSSGDAVITKYSSRLSRPFTIPAVSGSGTIYFKDSESVADAATHPENGWVQLEVTNFAQTDFLIARVWGQVTNYTDLSGGEDGEQSYTFTTRSSTFSTSGLVAKEGSAAIGWGLSGDPFIIWSLNDLAGAPYIRTGYWAGDNPYTAANRHLTTQTGNLSGLANLGGHNGFFTGRVGYAYAAITNKEAGLHGIPIRMYYGSNDGASIRIHALELNSDVESAVFPNGDVSQDNITRSSGTSNYYTYIDSNPASGQPDSDYIYNTAGKSGSIIFDMADISHTLTELAIEIYIDPVLFVDDYCAIYAQMWNFNQTTELTDEILLATSDDSGFISRQFTGIISADDTTWALATLKLNIIYDSNTTGASEVIRLEPSRDTGPYIALGSPLPTGLRTGGPGLWAGRDGSDYKIRIGDYQSGLNAWLEWDGTDLSIYDGGLHQPIFRVSTSSGHFLGIGAPIPTGIASGGPGFFAGWDTYASISAYKMRVGNAIGTTGAPTLYYDSQKLVFLDSAGVSKIELDSSGNSQFTGVMTIGTSGEIRQGTGTLGTDFDGIRIRNVSSVGNFECYNNDNLAVQLNESGLTLQQGTGQYNHITWYDSSVGFVAGDIETYTDTLGVNDAGAMFFKVYDEFDATKVSMVLEGKNARLRIYDDVTIDGGLEVGETSGTPSPGQLIINQGTADDEIIHLKSSDIVHGFTSITDTDTYGLFRKVAADSGGLNVRGLTESTVGVSLTAHATTMQSTAASTSSTGGIVLNVIEGASTTPTSGDNLVVMRGNGTTEWVLKMGGDVYINGTQNTYDAYDDVSLVRAASLLSPEAIKTRFDDYVKYNRDDLEAAGLVSGTMVNTTGFMKLHSGAIWQLHMRIKQLEEQLKHGNN